jgi:hypothetical protein
MLSCAFKVVCFCAASAGGALAPPVTAGVGGATGSLAGSATCTGLTGANAYFFSGGGFFGACWTGSAFCGGGCRAAAGAGARFALAIGDQAVQLDQQLVRALARRRLPLQQPDEQQQAAVQCQGDQDGLRQGPFFPVSQQLSVTTAGASLPITGLPSAPPPWRSAVA